VVAAAQAPARVLALPEPQEGPHADPALIG
jgi:hypothetical protein